MRWAVAAGALSLLCIGCGRDRLLNDDHEAAFRQVFEAQAPGDVEVVHSMLRTYRWRLGQVSTPDWQLELVAPREWVDRQIQAFHLAPTSDHPHCAEAILARQEKTHARWTWYAPQAIERYETYCLTATSIPYVHLLIDKEPRPDGRLLVYLSKH